MKVKTYLIISNLIMKSIIIVGAGGFGREAYYLIKEINKVNPTWNIKGFIDDNLDALNGIKCDCPIIGKISEWIPSSDEVFAMGIASPKTKEKLSKVLIERGAVFVTLIHPMARINEDAIIGDGCVITGTSSVGACTRIGNFVHMASSMIGQDAEIGDFSTTTAFVNLTNAIIGKRVFVGSHAVVLNKLKVGDDAVIGAGSVVLRNVKAGTAVFGCPAKKIDI